MKCHIIAVAAAALFIAAPAAAQSPAAVAEPQVLCVSVVAPAGDLEIRPGDTLLDGLVVTVLEPEACTPPDTGMPYDDFAILQEDRMDDLSTLNDENTSDDIDDPAYRDFWASVKRWAISTAAALKNITPQACYQAEYDVFVTVAKRAKTAATTMLKAIDQYDDERYSSGLKTLKKAGPQVEAWVDAKLELDDTYSGEACAATA